ncbi:MAG: hypothetical protein AVDCRST_MAG40-993 [uncultured Gemmatimonadaceae bacterium]|uniref:Uncharacterized protein n=1 Tax=uncultured Gemmatimonadaceae bacterium TaxID=246130 RepID=A0A6J4KQH8_9BACT|nr:MAG: hypothetical protein AVDCRST_MAG40-993 [uncultured Gemmatimonadaceae bacterium]
MGARVPVGPGPRAARRPRRRGRCTPARARSAGSVRHRVPATRPQAQGAARPPGVRAAARAEGPMTPVPAVAAVCGPEPRVAAMRPSCSGWASTSHRRVYRASPLTAGRSACGRGGPDHDEAASRRRGSS